MARDKLHLCPTLLSRVRKRHSEGKRSADNWSDKSLYVCVRARACIRAYEHAYMGKRDKANWLAMLHGMFILYV